MHIKDGNENEAFNKIKKKCQEIPLVNDIGRVTYLENENEFINIL